MRFLPRLPDADAIPYGVRVITYTTSIRWIGWGFAESLLPIFLFSFVGTYAATGLLRSAYDIGFLLALPIAGMAADRFRATTLIIIGLVLYLFIGSAYFLAGVTGFVFLVALARFLNGISYALDAIGRDTYIRRHTAKEKLATVFGYFDTVADFWWIAAALAGIALVQRFSIHGLLFMIVPTSLVALYIMWRFRRQEESLEPDKGSLAGAYGQLLRELSAWPWMLRLLGMFNFCLAFGSAAVSFFLPIEAFAEGAGLGRTILIGVAPVVPTLFGWTLGRWFDRKGAALFTYGFGVFGLLLGALALSDAYLLKLGVAFSTGIILELLSVGSNELITVHADPHHFGRVGSVMRSISNLGGMVGPLAIGILIDWQGTRFSYLTLALFMCLLAVIFAVIQREGDKTPVNAKRYHHKVHARA